MIQSLTVKNLKSISDITIQTKPLTILAGLNCSGKSTFIHSLRMLFSALNGKTSLLDNYGPFDEILHRQQSSNIDTPQAEEIYIQADLANEGFLRLKHPKTGEPLAYQILANSQNPIFNYISSDRLGPQKYLPVLYGSQYNFSVGEQGEYVIDCLSQYEDLQTPNILKHEKSQGITLKYNTSGWLSEIAPGFELAINRLSRHDISTVAFNTFRPHNVGSGLSYVLPIIVATLGLAGKYQETGEQHILALENPEAHLHPRGQTQMGRMLALAAASGLQVIVETHSDYIVDGARLAIRDGDLSHHNAIFLYTELSETLETQVTTIYSNEKGRLNDWPEGFFDQSRINKTELAGL